MEIILIVFIVFSFHVKFDKKTKVPLMNININGGDLSQSEIRVNNLNIIMLYI